MPYKTARAAGWKRFFSTAVCQHNCRARHAALAAFSIHVWWSNKKTSPRLGQWRGRQCCGENRSGKIELHSAGAFCALAVWFRQRHVGRFLAARAGKSLCRRPSWPDAAGAGVELVSGGGGFRPNGRNRSRMIAKRKIRCCARGGGARSSPIRSVKVQVEETSTPSASAALPFRGSRAQPGAVRHK